MFVSRCIFLHSEIEFPNFQSWSESLLSYSEQTQQFGVRQLNYVYVEIQRITTWKFPSCLIFVPVQRIFLPAVVYLVMSTVYDDS